MTLIPYVIQSGDHLHRLAVERGFDVDDVWNDDANRGLRDQGRTPNILAPGDVLHVPESPASPPTEIPTGKTTRFRASVPHVMIHLTFMAGGQPLANEPYLVEGLGRPTRKTADGQGKITLKIPVLVSELSLVLPDRDVTYSVLVGHLDPVKTDSGVRQRLTHLGLLESSLSVDPDRLTAVLGGFQASNQLPVTGVADDATRDALVREHGS